MQHTFFAIIVMLIFVYIFTKVLIFYNDALFTVTILK